MTREEAIHILDNLKPTTTKSSFDAYVVGKAITMAIKALEQEPKTGWNNHQIACMLADLFGDACACNYNGIDEWLGELCDFKDTCCPNPVGVACWEQFLKYSQSRYTECGYEVRDKNALQEPKTDVLDEIRAEIKEWYWQADKQAIAKDPCVVDAMIDLFIRTIAKYKAESEEV